MGCQPIPARKCLEWIVSFCLIRIGPGPNGGGGKLTAALVRDGAQPAPPRRPSDQRSLTKNKPPSVKSPPIESDLVARGKPKKASSIPRLPSVIFMLAPSEKCCEIRWL